ncbi:hypothetical protein MSAN_01581700 [Mycena sanguinolenta]|uniref:F-box domain-containing protein n=1 Tax=Mycena sanguinolenta TaxID=230812 RepID=A0A8H6Y321_9AGAR|nr:hypothetical protein MSAN_01581700 [Mycena sanguinolenta]
MAGTQRNHFPRLSDSSIGRILWFLEDSDLYDLSMTCVQLHKPALLMLLSRRKILNPLDTVDIQLDALSNTLRILRVALFVPTIQRLSLRFSVRSFPNFWGQFSTPLSMNQMRDATDCLLEEIRQLRGLLDKLESVDEITLILPGNLLCSLCDVHRRDDETSDFFPWSHVISFLQHAVGKYCRSFTVENSMFLKQDQASIIRIEKRQLAAPLVKALNAKLKHLCRVRPSANREESAIQHFRIGTTLLFLPRIIEWTISILRNSPVVSLHISNLEISSSDWDLITPLLLGAVPNLLELHLDDLCIHPDRVMHMLRGFSRLTKLTLGSGMSINFASFHPFRRWFLPEFGNLIHLSAPIPYVYLFLMRRNPLPALTRLEIPPINPDGDATRFLPAYVPHIIRRLRNLNHAVYPLPITFSLDWRGSDQLANHIDMSLASDPKISNNLRDITHLVFSDGLSPGMDPQLVCRWLRLFPALQHVSLDDAALVFASTATTAHLARDIFRACPTVGAVVARGIRYSPIVEGPNDLLSVFMNLPPEMLLIFDFLQDDELFALSILCRQFHFLALPLFLKRNSIDNPSEVVNFYGCRWRAEAVLRALTIALFVPSIKLLDCEIPAGYIYQRVTRIRQVTRLVQRLATVDSLSLYFGLDSGYRFDAEWDPSTKNRVWQTCFAALRDLFDAINSKSCRSLTLFGSPASASTLIDPCFPPPTIGSVTNVRLHVGYSSSYSSWIYSALKSNPVVSLELLVDRKFAAAKAPDFSATLLTLHLRGNNAHRSEVSKYLARHPLLTALTLEDDRWRKNYAVPLQPLFLRLTNLVTLTATLSYISYFIPNACDPPFPALKSLTILLDNPNDVGWALTSLLERVQESYPQPPTMAVEVGDIWDLSSLSDNIGFMTSMGGKWTHAARHIVRLKCPMPYENSVADPNIARTFSSWFGLFRGLRYVVISTWHEPINDLVQLGHSISDALPDAHTTIQLNRQTVFER